ncbi:MAG: hypothetical protein SGILL_005714 [Bacillariaceae sp.]
MTASEEIRRQAEQLRLSDEDLMAEETLHTTVTKDVTTTAPSCPVSHEARGVGKCPFQYVPLRMGGNGGTHKPSEGSRALIENEVSLEDLEKMTNTFYEWAFQDVTVDKFIRSHSDPHGSRFAKWIHQKLTGSHVWDDDRRTRDMTPHAVAGGRTAVVHDRSSAHAAAWYSPKRPSNEVGRHFKLDECRVWMRLHFLAMRKSGVVDKSPSFADYYVRFIGHFVSVYEGSATKFARDSFRWSADPKNVETYLKNGRRMNDVLDVSFWNAARDLPEDELEDDEWPYFVQQ